MKLAVVFAGILIALSFLLVAFPDMIVTLGAVAAVVAVLAVIILLIMFLRIRKV